MPFDFNGWDLDVNATEVDLEDSDITSDDLILIVERLKEMPNLVKLNLRGNQITSIEALSGLIHLTWIGLDDGVADPHRIVHCNKLRIKLKEFGTKKIIYEL